MSSRLVHIVDDDLSVRDSLHWLLNSLGIDSCVYETANAFLTATAACPAGCVLLDMRMPDIDGIAVLRALARRGMSAPVIVMTGHGDGVDASEVLRLGAADFIEKPFAADRLLAAIETAMGATEALAS
jgi:two-component system, LuxR family, response regulator FixJ